MNFPFFGLKNKVDLKHPVNFTTVFFLNILFVLFYLLFYFFSVTIHHSGINSDISNLTPWIKNSLAENDGIELYLMTLVMPVYIALGYLITKYVTLNFDLLSGNKVPFFYVVLTAIIFAVNFFVTEHPKYIEQLLIFFFASLIVSFLTIKLSELELSKGFKILFFFLSVTLLTVLGLLINNPPSIFDFAYYIGPANKILEGEKLGTFYTQYNLIGTSLFVLMQKFNLQIHQMYLVLVLIFSVWIFLYQKIASVLFQNRNYVFLFLLTLIIVRCLSISGGPVSIPQVSPIRMDLWVPLLMILLRYNFNSIVTASAFSIFYLADDVFGLMYLALYLFVFIIINISGFIKSKSSLSLKILSTFLPVIFAVSIHFLIFGSISSASGKIYSDFHIGFLPISNSSSFWFIVWLLPVCLYILTQNKKDQVIYLFIAGIACIQLTYFFGRSHEHNLLNISGIFIFILFLTLDSLFTNSSRNKNILYATVLLIAGMTVNYYPSINEKIGIAKTKIKTNSIFEPDLVENDLIIKGNYLRSFGTDKIIVISDIDSYINYRLGYRQIGYFSPFCSNVLIGQTTSFLKEQLNNGYRLILFPGILNNLEKDMISLNNSKSKEHFIVGQLQYGLMEVRLVSN
jgi:hypothetical protein